MAEMAVSVDISMYPLKDGYCQSIIDFIDRLDAVENITIQRNALSTQVFGDYKTVMALITDEMLLALQDYPKTVFVLKLVGTDRSDAVIDRCE